MSDSGSDIDFGDDDDFLEQRKQQMMAEAKSSDSAGPQPRPKTDDEIFREAFDPKSPAFHKGRTDAVAIGGTRVPEGMEAHANWQDLPEVAAAPVKPDEFGPEAERIFYLREDLHEFKKNISAPLPFVAALVQNTSQLESAKQQLEASDSKDDIAAKDVQRLTSLIEQNRKNLETSLELLKQMRLKYPEDTSEYGAELEDVIKRMSADSWTKEEHQQLIERSKRLGSRVFNQRNKLLTDWKRAKAEYLATKK